MQGPNSAPRDRRHCHRRGTRRLLTQGALGITLAVCALRGSATKFDLPTDGSAVIGVDTTITSHYEDTLLDLARRYSLGYDEIIRANPGIGKMGRPTPLGQTYVTAKIEHPSWYPPASIRKEHADAGDPLPAVVGPGPDNPLGDFKIRLAFGNGTYEIPPVDAQGESFEPNLGKFSDLLRAAVGNTSVAIHWDYAREALQKADGVIAAVGLEADDPGEPQGSQ